MRVTNPQAPASLPSAPVAKLVGHDGPVQTMAFTGDGKYCLTGGVDRTVRLWNPSRLDPAFPPPPSATVQEETNNKNIPFQALPHALPIQVYRDGITHPVTALAVDTEQSTTCVVGSDKAVVVLDVVSQQTKRRFTGQHAGLINAVTMSRDCETYLSASYDATVKIWDGRSQSSTKPIQTLKEATDSVTAVHVVQTDNKDTPMSCIRTASVDGIVRTYDLRQGLLRCDHMSGGAAAADNGQSSSGGNSPITSMAPTADGQCLVVSCLDGTIRLMELETGELLNTYDSHHLAGRYGLQCCVTADDATILTGSEDGCAVLYDLVRATPVQSLVHHDDDAGQEGALVGRRGAAGCTQRFLPEQQQHQQPTCAVAAHPQHSHVAVTANYDASTVVWANSPDFMRWQ